MEDQGIEQNGKSKKKRHWKSSNLPCVFTIRGQAEEKRKLEEMARSSGLSLSRLMIEGTLRKTIRTAEQFAREREDVEEMIFQIRRVGVNLNQINTALNAVRRGQTASVTEEKLDRAVAEVESLIQKLKKKL